MLVARILEDKLAALYRGGMITGGVYVGRGQEAACPGAERRSKRARQERASWTRQPRSLTTRRLPCGAMCASWASMS